MSTLFYCMVFRTDCTFYDYQKVLEVDTREAQHLSLLRREIEKHLAGFVSHNTIRGL